MNSNGLRTRSERDYDDDIRKTVKKEIGLRIIWSKKEGRDRGTVQDRWNLTVRNREI